MPQVKYSLSAIGTIVAADVAQFMLANANAVADESVTTADGTKMIAHAIAYAISKYMSNPLMSAAFAAGVGPATAGQLIYTAMTPSTLEPS